MPVTPTGGVGITAHFSLGVSGPYAPLIPNPPDKPQYFGEDAEQIEDSLDPQGFVESYQQADAPAPPVEDGWDWSEDVFDEDLSDDGYNVQFTSTVLVLQPILLDYWADDDDGGDEPVTDSQPVGPDAPSSPPDDILLFDDDYEDSDLTDDGFNVQVSSVVISNALTPDGWPWEFENDIPIAFFDHFLQTEYDPVIDYGDAAEQADDSLDDVDLTDDGFNVQSSSQPIPAALAPEDFQAADDLDDDWEWVTLDSSPVGPDAVLVVSSVLDDSWDWSEDVSDDWEAAVSDSAPVGPNLFIVPSQPPEDAWDHDDYSSDDWDWGTTDSQPVGPNKVIP